jgi:hypothetical protein
MKALFLSALLALGAGACAALADPSAQSADAEPAAVSTCGMERYESLVGQPESAARAASLPDRARVICHECAVTMDYHENRLNVWIGENGTVERLSCG